MRRIVAVAAAIVVSASACGGGDEAATPRPVSRPSSTATLEIVQPEAGAVVDGPTVHVVVRLTGGEIVPQATRDLAPNTGHVHLRLNGRLVSHTFGTEQELTDVAPGEYRLEAEFVAADHAPFNPRVITLTTFTVR